MAQVLRLLPKQQPHPDLIVGTDTMDDAGVFRLTDELALVQTLDFFTPIVDDAFTFGEIAAANALSDVYAMGGRPITALNLVAYPNEMDKEILAQILQGGLAKMQEAGVTLLGGHTVDDPEPKYGLCVTGIVHPDQVVTNAGAQPGDALVLTKPLGIGVVTTALKSDDVAPDLLDQAIRCMTTLNAYAASVMEQFSVHACTDITGFGLLGHLYEMTTASKVAARVVAPAVPILPGSEQLADKGYVCGGSKANRRYLDSHIAWDDDVAESLRVLVTDAITSGGLLMAVPQDHVDRLVQQLAATDDVLAAAVIGEIVAGTPGHIDVVSK